MRAIAPNTHAGTHATDMYENKGRHHSTVTSTQYT